MRRLLALVVLCLLLSHAAGAAVYMDGLGAVSSIKRTDGFALCQKIGACTSADSLKYGVFDDIDASLGIAYAKCANAAGDGAIIQAATDKGRAQVQIIGPCAGDTAVTFNTERQLVRGPATITVSSVIAGAGTFVCGTGGQGHVGPIFHDLRVVFAQTNTSSRASLTNFKDGFHLTDCFSPQIENIRMEECMVCIALVGDSGQATIRNIGMSPLSVGIQISSASGPGSADTNNISDIRLWPFGAEFVGGGCGTIGGGTGLCAIWNSLNLGVGPETTSGTDGPIGFYINGTMDDLNLVNSMCLVGQCIYINNTGSFGTSFTPLINIANVAGDTFPFINMKRGNVQVTGGYCTSSQYCFAPSGGELSISGLWMLATGSVAPLIEHTGGILTITGGRINMNGQSQNAIHSTGGFINATGLQIKPSTGTTVKIEDGSTATLSALQRTAAAGTSFITVDTDTNPHRVVGNSAGSNSCPATQTNMRSGLNGTGANATCN